MSNFGGKNSQFEKDFNKRIKALDASLTKIENRITLILQGSLKDPKATKAYWNEVRRLVDKEYKNMVAVYSSWAHKEIPTRYKHSVLGIQKRINNTKAITNTATKTAQQIIGSRGGIESMQLLIQNAVDDFATAAAAGQRNVNRWTRLTQQKLISDAQMDLVIGSVFTETGDLGKAITGVKTDLWNALTKSLSGEHYVQAGKYKYKPRYYAEMVSRVKFHEAHTEATITQAANYGTDLVQVSSHNTTTDICQTHEGKVYSISGKDKRFPKLDDSPPYHPNCLHLIYPTFESAMEIQGTLKSFSAFSQDKISRPPVPAGFVPVTERMT